MPVRQRRYSLEDFARRGTEIYERHVRPQVEGIYHGQVVAVDIDSGAFEAAEDTLTASHRVLANHPEAQIWCVRVGYPAVHHLRSRNAIASVSRPAAGAKAIRPGK